MILPEKVQDEVRDLWQELHAPVEIRFYSDGDPEASDTMRTLWNELHDLSEMVQFTEVSAPLSRFLPEREDERQGPISEVWLEGEFSGIRYLGIPSGHEFGGLIDTVRSLSTGLAPEIGNDTRAWLQDLGEDLHLEVFVTPSCPYCPQAVRLAQEMARINPRRITADMVDCTVFSRLSTRLNVMGVPMTLVNDRARVTGAAPEATLMEAVHQAFDHGS